MAKKCVVPVSSELKIRLYSRVKECISTLEKHYGIPLITPRITYELRGRNGGKACTNYDTQGNATFQELQINSVIYTENVDNYLYQVIGHEMAHIAVRQVYGYCTPYGKRIRPHGREWKSAMLALGLTPDVTHSYDTTNARVFKKTKKRHVYTCGCNTDFYLTSQKHKKLMHGMMICRCRSCSDVIQDTGRTITFK